MGTIVPAVLDDGDVIDNYRQTALIAKRTDVGLDGYGEANATPHAVNAQIVSGPGLPRAPLAGFGIELNQAVLSELTYV